MQEPTPSATLAASQPLDLRAKALAFVDQFEAEAGHGQSLDERRQSILAALEQDGSYTHTPQELAFGARLAWRNNSRCIGRLYWETLQIRDCRDLTSADDMFEALVEHARLATNGGKLKPYITVFRAREPGRPGIRIWNPQLVRYAGYRQADGSIVGDPQHVALTEAIMRLGWPGGERSAFDILPIVIHLPGEAPRWFELPRDVVLEVPITHPRLDWFAELGLKWHALPAVSDMRMEIGGVSYTAAPFSGWYMVTEIGARNFGDISRYNLLPVIADRMGMDTHTDRSLWRDRALVELNAAVIHSFASAGVSMVDHHTASRQFVRHEEKEIAAHRELSAQWSWIVPPISGSATVVWPRHYEMHRELPNFFYQRAAWVER